MKRRHTTSRFIAGLTLAIAFPTVAWGLLTKSNIFDAETSYYSGTNQIEGDGIVVAGEFNNLQGNAGYGGDPYGGGSYDGVTRSIVVGEFNMVTDNYSALEPTENSLVVGEYNTAWGGKNTLLVGEGNTANIKNSSALGRSLVAGSEGALAVGTWNVYKPTSKFVVGIGSSSASGNALEVYDDGTVVVPGDNSSTALEVKRDGTITMSKAHGGISMGRFTAP